MPLFDKKKAEEKKLHKENMKDPAYAAKYYREKMGLNFEDLSDEQLEEKNDRNYRELEANPATHIEMNIGTMLAGASIRDVYIANKAIVEQNWIMIRQNEQIIRLLREKK